MSFVLLALAPLVSAIIYPQFTSLMRVSENGDLPWNATIYEDALYPPSSLELINISNDLGYLGLFRNCSGGQNTEYVDILGEQTCKTEINSVTACAVLETILLLYETSTSSGPCQSALGAGLLSVATTSNVTAQFCVTGGITNTIPLWITVGITNLYLKIEFFNFVSGKPNPRVYLPPAWCRSADDSASATNHPLLRGPPSDADVIASARAFVAANPNRRN